MRNHFLALVGSFSSLLILVGLSAAAEPVQVQVLERKDDKIIKAEILGPKEGRDPRVVLRRFEEAVALLKRDRPVTQPLTGWVTDQETVVSAEQARIQGRTLLANEFQLGLPEGSGLRAEFQGREVILNPGIVKMRVSLPSGQVRLLDAKNVARAVVRPTAVDASLELEALSEHGEIMVFIKSAAPAKEDSLQVDLDPTTGVPADEKQPPHGAIRWKLLTVDAKEPKAFRFKMQWIYNIDELRK